MKIVVLAGGLSPERDVSLCSGALIANALIDNGHQVLLADLYIGLNDDYEMRYLSQKSSERFHYDISEKEPDLQALKAYCNNGNALIGKNIIDACKKADLVFIALHGSIGENGQLQAVLDTYGIAYTGTGYIGCLLGMDKDISKKLMISAGIQTAPWKTYESSEMTSSDKITTTYPCVVKPLSCGSSVGISIVNSAGELEAAFQAAKAYESKILIEEKINGREFSVGILNGKALPSIEIIPKFGFYDYKNKYQSDCTTEVCPANISDTLEHKLGYAALRVHQTLQLGFYSRVDFIVDDKEELWCLEANTLPGMTPNSLLPQEAKAAGIAYHELCEQIVQAAII